MRRAIAAEAEAAGVELARALAVHPPDGMRELKALFRSLDGGADRVSAENAALERFQREGPGLPQRRG